MPEDSGQMVIFELDQRKYALPINNVSEIVRMTEITVIPKMQHYFSGIINLRGKVISVINPSLRLGLGEGEKGEDTRIIITEKDGHKVGLIVDSVSAVTSFTKDKVETNEDICSSEYITGIIHAENDGMIQIMNLEKIIT